MRAQSDTASDGQLLASAVALAFGLAQTGVMLWWRFTTTHGDFASIHQSAVAFTRRTELYANQTIPNLNPPHLIALLAPLGYLSTNAAAIVMWLLMAVAVGLVACAAARTGHRPLPIVAVLLASIASAAAVAHVNFGWLLAAGTVWAWLWARQGHLRRAAVLIGLLASAKVFFLLFLPYWAIKRDWELLSWAIGAFVAVFGIGFLIVKPDAYADWLQTLAHGMAPFPHDSLDASLAGALSHVVSQTHHWTVTLIGTAVVLLTSAWWFRQPRTLDQEWALVLTTMLLVSPLAWVYYWLIPAVPLAAVLTRPARWVGISVLVMPTGLAALAGLHVPAPTYGIAAFAIWASMIYWPLNKPMRPRSL